MLCMYVCYVCMYVMYACMYVPYIIFSREKSKVTKPILSAIVQ